MKIPLDNEETQAPLASRAVRGGVWVALSSYFNVAFGFLANLVLTRILFPRDFGVFALALFFFSLINLRTKLGVGYAFAQRKETTGELVGTHLTLDLGAALSTLLLAGLAAPMLRLLGYSWDVTLVMLALAGAGVLDSITSTAWGLMDRELRLGRTSLVSSLAFPLSYLPAFYLALRSGSYWSLVAQNAAYALFLLIGLWWAARVQLPHVWRLRWSFDPSLAKELLLFGLTVGVASIAGMLVSQFDNFLVGTFIGETTLGFYDRAYRIAQWPSLLVTGVLTRPTFYTYTRLQGDPARLGKTVGMTYWLVTILALPLALGIFVSAPELVKMLWGERWAESSVYLRYLVAYSLVRPLIDNAGMLFIAVGQPRRATVSAVIQALALMVIATPLTLAYGAVGTSIGVGISFVIGFAFIGYYVKQTVALSFREVLAVPLCAALAALIIFLWIDRLAVIQGLPILIKTMVKSGLAVSVFYSVILLIQPGLLFERFGYVWKLFRLKPQ
jgi:O-antigen/teichoic acid export membrane protein